MSGITWTKFFWSDWQSDPALRLCSYSARGLWMDMLCIAAAHDPIGYVAVAGRGLNETDIARMTGGAESEVSSLLGELDRNGVFSRDRHGRIYSRRMVADARRAAIAKKNGKQGGNPTLRNIGGNQTSDNHPDKGGLKPQEPEAIIQKESPVTPNGVTAPKGRGAAPKTDEDFELFWIVYPLKKAKEAARRAFPRALRTTTMPTILHAIERQQDWDQWRRGFIPNASTWLNQARWNDEESPRSQIRAHNDERPNARPARQTAYVERLGDIDAAMEAAFEPGRGVS